MSKYGVFSGPYLDTFHAVLQDVHITLTGFPKSIVLQITTKGEDEFSVNSSNEISGIRSNTNPYMLMLPIQGENGEHTLSNIKR